MKLKDQIAVVTGGSRGIGYAVVRAFLKEGAEVVLCASRSETAERAVSQLKAELPEARVWGIWPSLEDPEQVRTAFDRIGAEHGRIDILVNNAGVSESTPFGAYTGELFDRVMDLNVKGMFHCARGAVPWMERQGRGVILNTSSMVSFYGQPAGVAYPVSKFAVNGFTLSLARELAEDGYTLLAAGEMGIGNTTTTAAVACALLGLSPQEAVGRGAGLSDAGLARKRRAVERALEVNRPDSSDPVDILCKVGGLDIAAMTGFYLGCAAAQVPVILDGAISAAAALLAQERGNILLTTGSKELARYSGMTDFARRVYARVLPMAASLEACRAAGLEPGHILAVQGPFSREWNAAMLRAVCARFLVTKEAGAAGGFAEKAAAAEETGATLVVVGRPPQREGEPFDAVVRRLWARFGLVHRPRVTLVGIGPGAASAMTEQEIKQANTAERVFLAAAVKILDAIEDIDLKVVI